ncbi:MAG: hypothetical protein K0S79_2588, partial [Nitrospira sp.]|nr:hypothetical protein [Nitrospira sp.]
IPRLTIIQWIGIAVQYKTIYELLSCFERREDEETARIELSSPSKQFWIKSNCSVVQFNLGLNLVFPFDEYCRRHGRGNV